MSFSCARPRPRAVPLLIAAFAFLSACDDPSSVGLGLVDDQGEAPVSSRLATETAPLDVRDITGGADRVLAGAVDDPLLGGFEATAFVDFGTAPGAGATFRATQVDALALRISATYSYGDTTGTKRLALYASPEDYGNTSGFRADTTLARGDFIRDFDLTPSADRVVVPLPAAYLASVQSAIRSEDFTEDYFGLFIAPASDGSSDAILGFDFADIELLAVQGTDTLAFPGLRTGVVSLLQRTSPAQLPADRLLLQDGTGPGVTVRPDFAALTDAIVHGARLQLTLDTTAVGQTPVGFVRPVLGRLSLFALESDGTDVFLAQGIRSGDTITFSDRALRSYVQRIALGTTSVDRFELRFDTFFASLNGLNAALLKLDDDGVALDVVATDRRGGE